MVAKAAEMAVLQPTVLDVQFYGQSNDESEDVIAVSSPSMLGHQVLVLNDSFSLGSKPEANVTEISSAVGNCDMTFTPRIRSGSFADKGPRRSMEDEHIRIDDLSSYFGSLFKFPVPSAFYGVFDGHGGPEAAAYVRKNASRLFFEDVNFPQTTQVSDLFLEEVEDSLRRAFLQADSALAEETTVSSSSGTTALTALVFERMLLVANAGDCRAVLCRKGAAIDMSCDHRPTYPSEKRRVEESGGYVHDGYLNGVLSVSRALGDWDVKAFQGSTSPLIAEPEVQQMVLTEDDEFLILGCDGIWDVMTSQHAVNVARRELRRHGDPTRCARGIAMEAVRHRTFDNLTVIIVLFSMCDIVEPFVARQHRQRHCRITSEGLCSLGSFLEGSTNH